jgi:thioredoxin 1
VATLESAPPAAASPSPPPAAADQPTTAATASPEDPSPAKAAAGEMAEPPARQKALPRLVDLGADKCIPCKMMAPVLAELRQEYAGRFDVVFIDVWKNKGEAQKNGVRIIPTQIFYDASGKELFRHQGFFSKEDILKTWQKYGLDFARENAAAGSS